MIWDRMLNAELAEPAIREVHLNYATDQPLRADREDISHDQHPDHQFRIDRRPIHGRIKSCKFAAEPGKIESSIDLPYQMIFRDCVIELKLVEKLRLFALQPSHHGLPHQDSRQQDGITVRRKPQRTSATKSARNRHCYRSVTQARLLAAEVGSWNTCTITSFLSFFLLASRLSFLRANLDGDWAHGPRVTLRVATFPHWSNRFSDCSL